MALNYMNVIATSMPYLLGVIVVSMCLFVISVHIVETCIKFCLQFNINHTVETNVILAELHKINNNFKITEISFPPFSLSCCLTEIILLVA